MYINIFPDESTFILPTLAYSASFTSWFTSSSCTTKATYASLSAADAVALRVAVTPHLPSSPSYKKAWPVPLPSSITRPPSSGLVEPEFKRINLSFIALLVVFNVVKSPFTVKLPSIVVSFVTTKEPNVTLSVVCSPKSISDATPLRVDLKVPWLGEVKVDPDTTPLFSAKVTLSSETVVVIPLVPSKSNVP